MKKLLKNILKAFNLKLIKINVCTEPAYQTVQALKSHNINVVFDVGANIGQFAIDLRECPEGL